MIEKWKDIVGYEGLYQISDKGRIKSLRKNKILSVKNKTGWYLSLRLIDKNGNGSTKRIHRLVAEHFIPNPDNKPQVNHIDMNKQNNCVSNLEWSTGKENIRHALLHKPDMVKAMNEYNKFIKPKKINQYDLNGHYLATYISSKVASDFTGVCQRNILQVASKEEFSKGRVRTQAGGYIWRFENDKC